MRNCGEAETRRRRCAQIATLIIVPVSVCAAFVSLHATGKSHGIGRASDPAHQPFCGPDQRSIGGRRQQCPSGLFGISEWRDKMFDIPSSESDLTFGMEEGSPPKELCVLPFPYEEVLLQGETKQLRLYEDRFIELFEDCMANHCGVLGMGLIASAQSGIIQTIPLCEVEAYNRMGEGFGIFVTIRVVGRASLRELTQQEPYIKAVCTEITDNVHPNLDLANVVAGNIENFMLMLSSMEHRLKEAAANDEAVGEALDAVEDKEMKRRILEAKLEDKFYENEDDEEEEGDEYAELDRTAKFRRAFKVAKSTDTQGYMIQQPQEETERSPQDLTAISWAAFCTEDFAEQDATYRIQALDCDDLFERLKLASFVLREKKANLKKKLDLAGIKYTADDVDLDDGSR